MNPLPTPHPGDDLEPEDIDHDLSDDRTDAVPIQHAPDFIIVDYLVHVMAFAEALQRPLLTVTLPYHNHFTEN